MDSDQIPDATAAKGRTLGSKVKTLWSTAMRLLTDLGRKLWPGAAVGLIAGSIVFACIIGANATTGLGIGADIAISVLLGLILLLLGYFLVLRILKLIKSLPARFIALFVAAGAILFGIPGSGFGRLLFIFALVNGAIIGFAYISGLKRVLSIALFIVVAGADIYLLSNLWSAGTDAALLVPAGVSGSEPAHISAPNPSLDGLYNPKLLCYGSGWDRRRPEYGESVLLKTPTVDATPFLSDTGGIRNTLREWYWGFDLRHCPLNARVWYPEGSGPFPLVLIVHGNHQMEKYSEGGYDYLGKLLASRGFIFASVDENFLNGNWLKDYEQKENFARGWLLLEHLRLWREWDKTRGALFFGKVDTDNIALIGHSRGGQAVAIAAAINNLPRYHTDARISFDFGFKIKGIIQIAPNDPYEPTSGHRVTLHDVNYLLLQGGYDGDVSVFIGDRQYNRVRVSGNGNFFKSALYIYRANHGQFNTEWGRTDRGMPASWLMNLAPIMSPGDQEQIAKVYIAGFLEAVLHGKRENLRFLEDHRRIAGWLPRDYYVSQFEDSEFRIVDDFEDGLDVTRATMRGVSVSGENLKTWSVNALPLRDAWSSTQENTVVYLGWDRKDTLVTKGTPTYSFSFSDSAAKALSLERTSEIVFSLCSNKDDSGDSLDISIQCEDAAGNGAMLPLSRFATIPPPLKVQLGKYSFADNFGASKPAERVLQRFSVPLSAFGEANGKFSPADIRKVSFVFDRSPSGEIALDNVGFEKNRER